MQPSAIARNLKRQLELFLNLRCLKWFEAIQVFSMIVGNVKIPLPTTKFAFADSSRETSDA